MSAAAPAPGGRVLAFFLLACALSWLDWGLVIASARGWIPWRIGANPWGSFGPALAALLLAARDGGRAGVRDLLRLRARFSAARGTLAMALLAPLAIVALAIGASVLAGESPGAAVMPDPVETLVLALAIAFVGGPLGEEIGWRGYALPRLLSSQSALVASLVVAAMWAVWHLPLFWLPGAAQEGSSIPGFVALVAAFSIVTTALWLRGGGSLGVAIAFHWSINLGTYLLPTVFPALAESRTFSRCLLAVGVLAGLAAVMALRRIAPLPVRVGNLAARGG